MKTARALDYPTYRYVKEQAETIKERKNSAQRQWYATFEQIFKAQELEKPEDLYKFIAFAYSWMPTIPSIYFDRINSPESFLPELQALRRGESVDRKELVHRLAKVVNHSVTGASKVLHFIAPQAPIIDSRVIVAWRMLFSDKPGIVKFPKHRINDLERMVDKYIEYWKLMDQWLFTCQKDDPAITMRDLEFSLYWYSLSGNE